MHRSAQRVPAERDPVLLPRRRFERYGVRDCRFVASDSPFGDAQGAQAALAGKDHANEAMDTQFGRGRVARMPNSVWLRGLRA